MTIVFKKAEKKQAKLRLAFTGPAGAGKTMSSLSVARGIVGPSGKIAVVDTERDSASLYADLYEFDSVNLTPPYTTEKYIEAIHAAEDAGYDIVIIDSISHAWAGAGGLLDQQDALASAKGSDRFRSWGKITPKHQEFIDVMLACKIHLIATMRSKTEYALVATENGKTKPEKLGLAPVQRDGMDYEFTTVLDIDTAHMCQASKDRTGLFANRIFVPDESIGGELRAWLDSGSAPSEAPAARKIVQTPTPKTAVKKQAPTTPRPKNPIDADQVKSIRENYRQYGFSEAAIDAARWFDGTDELWDGDAIQEDWKTRYNIHKQQTAKPTTGRDTGSTAPKCPECGGNPMTQDERKQLLDLMDAADDAIPKNLCKECGRKIWDSLPKQQPTPAEPQTDEEWNVAVRYTKPCTVCGKTLTRPEAKHSLDTTGTVICPACLKQELQIRAAKKKVASGAKESTTETETPAYVCSICGKPITKTRNDTCELFKVPVVCTACENKDGGAA